MYHNSESSKNHLLKSIEKEYGTHGVQKEQKEQRHQKQKDPLSEEI